jgi:Tol biopolymer transport system component
VACPISFKEANAQYFKIVGYNVGGGEPRTISDKHWREISGGVWLPNGNLVIAAVDAASDSQAVPQLWNISSDGQAKALTSGLVGYRGLSATRDGTVLVTHQLKTENDLWMLPNNDSSKAQQITGSGEIRGGFAYAPDGRIIIGSNITGNADLWMINVDKADRKRLTNEGGVNVQPVISPDNKYVVFSSNRGDGKIRLYRMDMDGQHVKRLTDQTGDIIPYTSRISLDGKSIFYVEVHDGKADMIKNVSIDGGEAVTVANPPDGWEFTTLDINRSDGRFAYGLTRKLNGPSEYKIEIASANGKTVERLIDLPPELGSRNTRWMPDGRAVAVLEKSGFGSTEVWQVPIEGKGKPGKITDFRTPVTNNFLWSPDGKFMLASHGTRSYEAVLIRTSAN